MAQRVAAVFTSRESAERAASALIDLGAEREQISMLGRGEHAETAAAPTGARPDSDDFVEPAREVGDSGAALTTTDDAEAAKGAATGATIGAVAGIAAGLAMLTVPGVGVIMAAGPLAWALGGAAGTAAAGAVVGGVYGGLKDIGIDEQYARSYEERIRGGDLLLTAVVPSTASEDQILDVLAEHGADDVSFAEDTLSTASWARPTGQDAGYNSNIAMGEAKKAEGEWRDRAADYTANPLDDLAAKGKKLEGELQEEFGEAEEAVDRRRM